MSTTLHKARRFLFIVVNWLEFIVSLFVLAGIIVHLFGLTDFWALYNKVDGLADFLKYMFDALIGIELIKLLCRNDLFSMIEVLLFAVTRHLIIQHLTTFELLLGVLAIAVLFAVRKFLFVHAETHSDSSEKKEMTKKEKNEEMRTN